MRATSSALFTVIWANCLKFGINIGIIVTGTLSLLNEPNLNFAFIVSVSCVRRRMLEARRNKDGDECDQECK